MSGNDNWTAGQKDMHKILDDAERVLNAYEWQLNQIQDNNQPGLHLRPSWLGNPPDVSANSNYNREVIEKAMADVRSGAQNEVNQLLNKMAPNERMDAVQQLKDRDTPDKIEGRREKDISDAQDRSSGLLNNARENRLDQYYSTQADMVDQQKNTKKTEEKTDQGKEMGMEENFIQPEGQAVSGENEKNIFPESPGYIFSMGDIGFSFFQGGTGSQREDRGAKNDFEPDKE